VIEASSYLQLLLLGCLLTWLLQTNGLLKPVWALHPKLEELADCDLCLGFWVYLVIGLLAGAELTGLLPWWAALVEYAAVSSFLAHLLRMGWMSKFGVTILE